MNKQPTAFIIHLTILVQSQTFCRQRPLKVQPCRTESNMSDGKDMLTFEPSLEFYISFSTVGKY